MRTTSQTVAYDPEFQMLRFKKKQIPSYVLGFGVPIYRARKIPIYSFEKLRNHYNFKKTVS